jgi:hypothetical protein
MISSAVLSSRSIRDAIRFAIASSSSTEARSRSYRSMRWRTAFLTATVISRP